MLAHSFGARLRPGDEILLSILEHHSNLVPWQRLAQRQGVVLRFLPMTPEGRLDLDRLDSELTERCRLVALTHCSNVTGALTDVGRVVAAARAVGAKVMLDGAQRAPHGPLDLRNLDVDFYVFSGHKAYGPTGIGVLWGRRELLDLMPPFMTGGQMIEEVTLTHATFRPSPRRFEAGTPPIAAAVGLGAALDWMEALDWRVIQDYELRSDAPAARRTKLDSGRAGAGARRYQRSAGRGHLLRRALLPRGCLPSPRSPRRGAAGRSSLRPAAPPCLRRGRRRARKPGALQPGGRVEALLAGVEELVRARPGRAHHVADAGWKPASSVASTGGGVRSAQRLPEPSLAAR